MIEPYYEQDGITIYCADCRDVLPHLEPGSVDLVLTDPPYGMNLDTDYSGFNGWSGKGIKWDRVIGDDEPFNPELFLEFPNAVLWGANFYASRLPDTGAWLVFNKRGNGKTSEICFGDCELAWTSLRRQSIRMFSHMWHGVSRWSSEGTLHPTQKPVSLMRWCLEFFPDAQTILDPFMGSGTTLRAAKDLGRKAIGIEISREYCDIAIRRLQQQTLPLGLDQVEQRKSTPQITMFGGVAGGTDVEKISQEVSIVDAPEVAGG